MNPLIVIFGGSGGIRTHAPEETAIELVVRTYIYSI